MFSDRGWTALVNDDIVDTVLTIGSWVGGLLVMLAAFGYASAVGLSAGNTSLVMAMGFFFGHLMFLITTGVVSSAVATVYVCFAERPEVFQSTHPLLYLELHGAWTVLYPNYRKMPPYDNDVVSVTSPSKGIPFSGAPGTGTGTGAGGAALQRVSAGGGWNTYRPPSEAEVLSRPDVNANFAEQDQVLAQSSLFAEPLAGSAYKPLFDIDAEAELGDRHLGNAFGYVNTPSPGTGTGPMTGMGRMSKIQTPSSAGRGSALHTRTTGAGAGTGNGMSVTEMASSAYSNLASIVLNSTAQAPVNVKTSTPLPAQPPVTAAPATDASTPQSTSITTASGNKPKTNAPLSAPVSAERPGHDDTVTF